MATRPSSANSALLRDLTHPATPLLTFAAGKAHPQPAASPTPVNLSTKKAIKLGVSQAGWYRVAFTALKTAGFNPGNGKNLHLYAEGIEQPFELTTTGIEFYGTGLDTPSTATRVYWLASGAANKNHIAISTATGGPSAGSDFLSSVELRERSTYFPAANAANGIDYFGDFIDSTPLDEPALIASNLSRPDNAMLEVGLQGVTAGAHNVTVELNGVTLDTVSFNDLANATFQLPASSIVNGANIVTLTTESASDFVLVDHLTLSYERSYTADGDQLEFTATAADQVVVNGFTNPSVRMVDITDPAAPIELTVTATPNVPGSFAATAPGSGTRTILAFGAEKVATPDSIALHKPLKLTPLAGKVDTLLITTADFMPAVQPLIKLRESRRSCTSRPSTSTMCTTRSTSARRDPQAIKNFLAATQTAKRPPHYVLLVGDATDDPRGFLTGSTRSRPGADQAHQHRCVPGAAAMAGSRISRTPTSRKWQSVDCRWKPPPM